MKPVGSPFISGSPPLSYAEQRPRAAGPPALHPSLALRPDTPNLRLFLTGPDGTSHIVTMRSTFSIESDDLSRESARAFHHHHAAGMVRALGLRLREIEVMSAYSMEIGN